MMLITKKNTQNHGWEANSQGVQLSFLLLPSSIRLDFG